MGLVPRDDARLQRIDGAHVPVLALPHLLEIRVWTLAGVLRQQKASTRCHEDVRVVQCLDHAIYVAGVERGEDIQNRLTGPTHDLRALVCA